MKKSVVLFTILTLILIFAIGGFIWLKNAFNPKSATPDFNNFLVTKGASAMVIAENLEEKGFIKSALAFKIYTQFTGISRSIGAGEYRLSPHMSISEILKTLTSAPVELWVTVPEGLRREEIVERYVEGLDKTGDEANTFRAEFLETTRELEGFLFPDTYLFPKEVSASAVVTKMKNTFDAKIAVYEEEIQGYELSLDEIVILASILERETVTDEERPVVAGLLLNRLRIGMGLQADATVQYAVGTKNCKSKIEKCDWWHRPITADDLAIDSPYNTRRYSGLPPGPIASPGVSSLKAVINPTDSDYFYYLHDSDGKIHYGRTLDEHNANKAKYL